MSSHEDRLRTLPSPASLDPTPGTYILLFKAPTRREVRIGKLGTLELEGGWLAYVGSALGSGGLRARLGRHLSGDKKPYWHIDYLVAAVSVEEVWYAEGGGRREESWVEALRRAPGASVPLRGFGSGDCGCSGHLVAFEEQPELERFRAWLKSPP